MTENTEKKSQQNYSVSYSTKIKKLWPLYKLHFWGVGEKLPEADWNPAPLEPELIVNNSDIIQYHMTEFSILKSELSDLVKQTYVYLTYAFGISGAIFAWLLTQSIEERVFKIAICVPFFVSFFFSQLAVASKRRIDLKAAYLLRIEDRFRALGLGWERLFLQKRESISLLHRVGWALLVIGTFIIAASNLFVNWNPNEAQIIHSKITIEF